MVGPIAHFFAESSSSLPVGIRKAGPAPQINPLAVGFFGEKKRLCVMSPMPVWLPEPGNTSLWAMIGRMVREMTVQVSLMERAPPAGC